MTGALTLGIDATNLRQGGGRTHLIEVLRAADPTAHGFNRVVVWGSHATLALLEDRPWLQKRNPPAQERGMLLRSLWQRFGLSRTARAEACDVLWVPGGAYAGDFHPVVTMSRNLLPFDWQELRRYGVGWMRLRLLLLRWAQSQSFRRAEAVIFLTQYAATVVQQVTGRLPGETAVIAHGLSPRYRHEPKPQQAIERYSSQYPFRILYVSIIDQYKHQWNVVEAVAAVQRRIGRPVALDLIGPSYPPALARLRQAMEKWDAQGEWVTWHGDVPHSQLHMLYAQADLGIFASSCENMPNILLETMAAGLPIASSNRGPMPEILGDAGVYFDPEDPLEIAWAVEQLIADPDLRARLANQSFAVVQKYSWERCAEQTFDFIAGVWRQWMEKQKLRAA